MASDENLPKDKDPLSNRGLDYLVASLRSVSGLIPGAGPFVSELLTVIIPNQRIDRIRDFVRILDSKLQKFERKFLDEQANRSDCTELFEESFRQAARSTTEERRTYIANLLTNGLETDQINYLKSRFLLQLLNQINDAEVIVLYHYALGHSKAAQELEEKHPDLVPRSPIWGKPNVNAPEARAIRQAYHDHLADLGCLVRQYETTPPDDPSRVSFGEADISDFFSKPAEVQVKNLEISELGETLLKFILQCPPDIAAVKSDPPE